MTDVKTENPLVSVAELDAFTRAYVEAALWSTNDESTEAGGEPMDTAVYDDDRNLIRDAYDIYDIALESLAGMAADCKKFQAENAADLALYNHPQWTAAELGGHDFWLTRCGHGCGFWDRSECLPEEAGQRLTEASEKFGNVDLYVGDDGKIYSN